MSFLEKNELNTVSEQAVIDLLINADDTIINTIISESISIMKGHLSRYYQADMIFAATGEDRNLTVLKYLKLIVIYEASMRIARAINEVVRMQYVEAMHWLEQMNTGKFRDTSLPSIESSPISDQEAQDTRFGGNKKYNSSF